MCADFIWLLRLWYTTTDLHLFPRVKIPRNLFPRGFLQGTNVARHLFSKGNGFPSGAIPRVSNSKGIDLHVLHIPREHFPRPNFQGPISKVQFPRSNFHVPISKSQFPSPNFQPPSNQAKRDYLSGNKIIIMLGNPPNPKNRQKVILIQYWIIYTTTKEHKRRHKLFLLRWRDKK